MDHVVQYRESSFVKLGRNRKMAALRQNQISYICRQLLPCKPNGTFYHLIFHLCANIGALNPLNKRIGVLKFD